MTRVSCRIARMSPITEDRKKLEFVMELQIQAMVIYDRTTAEHICTHASVEP